VNTLATNDALENRYYAFLRGREYISTDALLEVLRVYLAPFDGLDHVADVGCGHGEFMLLLQEHGHGVSGVDLDPGMVAHCRGLGLDVTLGDAVTWLAARPDLLDGVFSSNVIEHLDAPTLQRWLSAAWSALRPGGKLLLATPNPESAIVQLHEFWRDPTHVRLYSRQLLEFLAADAGFVEIATHENPAAAWDGVSRLLEEIETTLPPAPVTDVSPELTPFPAAPARESGTRAGWAFKATDFVYRKFTQPWFDATRADTRRALELLAEQAAAMRQINDQVSVIQSRLQRLAEADRFLYPSREIYVVATKPISDETAAR
jgi:SAM-dependent methyltransferase